MDSRIIALEAIGCDVKGALGRFLDDEQLYVELLEEFVKDYNFVLLQNALSEKNYEKAFFYAHTIKGVVGNLGLTHIYKACCQIVEPLRNGIDADYSALFCTLWAARQEYVNIIEN